MVTDAGASTSGSASDRVRYVVLASHPYSGSTLLSGLLGAHPEIATVSDVSGARREHRLAEYRCSCGRLLLKDPFWDAVRREMRRRGYPDFELGNFRLGFDRAPGTRQERLRTGSLRWTLLEQVRDAAMRFVPGHAAAMRAIGERNRDFAQTILDITGKPVFLDASKERMRLRHLLHYGDLDLRAIHLVRDVRGVVDSSARHQSSRNRSPTEVAAAWARTNRAFQRQMCELPPDRRLTVRYEDLCEDVPGTLARLHRFCGVASDARPSIVEQHLLGNQRRLGDLAEVRLDERWKSTLAVDQRRRILSAAGRVHRELYPDAATP